MEADGVRATSSRIMFCGVFNGLTTVSEDIGQTIRGSVLLICFGFWLVLDSASCCCALVVSMYSQAPFVFRSHVSRIPMFVARPIMSSMYPYNVQDCLLSHPCGPGKHQLRRNGSY